MLRVGFLAFGSEVMDGSIVADLEIEKRGIFFVGLTSITSRLCCSQNIHEACQQPPQELVPLMKVPELFRVPE